MFLHTGLLYDAGLPLDGPGEIFVRYIFIGNPLGPTSGLQLADPCIDNNTGAL